MVSQSYNICIQNYSLQTSHFVNYTDGTPVSYQVWNNYLIKNPKLQTSIIQKRSRKKYLELFSKAYVEKILIAQKTLQPESELGDACVAMLTAVLSEPDWITVPCNDKFSDYILCQQILNHPIDKSRMIKNTNPNAIKCAEGVLYIGNKCILFEQYQKLTNHKDSKKYKKSFTKNDLYPNVSNLLMESFSLIQHYFTQPLEFTLVVGSNAHSITYKAIQSSTYGKLHWINQTSGETISQHDGYLLHPVTTSKTKVPRTVFQCTDGSYIDETLVCDGSKDCTEGADEKYCMCANTSQSSYSVCKYKVESHSQKISCSDYFYQCSSLLICIPYTLVCNGQRDCHNGEDEICSDNMRKNGSVSQMFVCLRSGISIPVSFVDDLIPDCPGTYEDELQYFNLLRNYDHSKFPCNSSYEIPCIPGHSYCFSLSKLCIYDLQQNSSQLKYCRNGAHLYNCTNFQCPGFFKCSLSYCVPFDLVCNNNWDCPGGDDEHDCVSHPCSHLFKCKNQDKCLHLSKVCDKSKDCTYGDDELSCGSGYFFTCPLHCICFAKSIVCDHLNHMEHLNIWSYINYFKCYSCHIDFSNIQFSFVFDIKFLDIKGHLSTNVCINKDENNLIFFSLRKLDMSYNNINIIKSSCLISLDLTILYLQQNKIAFVEDDAFHTLINLKILDLSQNKITKLSKRIFAGLHNIAVINLTANLITIVNDNTFKSIHQNTVHSLNRQVCCMSGSWLKCKVRNDDFSNCNDLLSNDVVAQVCWFVGILTVVTNSISILIHIKFFSQLHTNKFFTFGLSLVDCVFGMYLLTISSADSFYGRKYVGLEYLWKHTMACEVSSLCSLASLTASPIMLFVMMFARFSVIQWPMDSKFKCEIFNRRIILAIIIAIIGCCIIVVLTFINGLGYHIPTSICILLYANGKPTNFILFTSLLIICVQLFCLISNIIITVLTILALSKKKSPSVSSSLKKGKYNQIIIHLLIIIFSNMCCWIPSTVVFILPLAGYQVSNHLLSWIITIVVPINCIVDPILLSILTPHMKKWFSSTWISLKIV